MALDDRIPVVIKSGQLEQLQPPEILAIDQVNIVQTMTTTSTAGVQSYVIPIGNFVADLAGQSTLQVDMGAGFVSVPYPAGYQHYRRSSPGTPATVVDAAIGFTYLAGPVAAGWTFRFRWREPRILTPPIAIAKVLLPQDLTVRANSNDATNYPNGVQLPVFPGVSVEFWRQTFRSEGPRYSGGGPPNRVNLGRRYLPYYRGALNVFEHTMAAFSPGANEKRSRFKCCYYDPVTGARSMLSADTVVVCSNRADGVNGRSPVRSARSVWIE